MRPPAPPSPPSATAPPTRHHHPPTCIECPILNQTIQRTDSGSAAAINLLFLSPQLRTFNNSTLRPKPFYGRINSANGRYYLIRYSTPRLTRNSFHTSLFACYRILYLLSLDLFTFPDPDQIFELFGFVPFFFRVRFSVV